MQLLQQLFALLWSFLEKLLSAVIGPFTRALSVRRVDDGTGP